MRWTRAGGFLPRQWTTAEFAEQLTNPETSPSLPAFGHEPGCTTGDRSDTD